MKILQIFKTYYPDTFGGVEAVIHNIYLETQKYGAVHQLLTVSPSPRIDEVAGLPVMRLQKNFEIASCPFSWTFFKNFKKAARDFDILHFHYPWPFADLTMLLSMTDRPAIVTFHADALKHRFLKRLYLPLQKRFLQKVDQIVPTSAPLMETSPDLAPFQHKCTIIPIGIDPKAYPAPSPVTLQKWQNRLGTGFVLFVGVLRHYKGLHTLIEAAGHINLPIVIAGDGPLRNVLEQQIHTAGLTHIHLLGRISEEDKTALYHLCGMVVLPSCTRAEAFGVSLLEGLMYKKPLISTALGTGTSFVNQHQQTGLVIPPDNAEALAAAIKKLQSPLLAEKFGTEGYKWFMAEFQSVTMGRRYFELYQELLK